MRNKSIKQRIIAVILCFVMLFGLVHIENFINNEIADAGGSAIHRVYSLYTVGIFILGLAEITFALKKSPSSYKLFLSFF